MVSSRISESLQSKVIYKYSSLKAYPSLFLSSAKILIKLGGSTLQKLSSFLFSTSPEALGEGFGLVFDRWI